MPRSKEMQAVVDAMSQQMFGRKPTDGKCVCCGSKVEPLTGFRDELSRREYPFSHLCQACQDETFAPPPGEE